MFLLWKIVFAINFVCLIVDCQFENQYLGHYITREQYNSQEIACQTKICLRDSQRLLLQATQNDTVEPCDDFEEFSMGQFKKFAALNERYSYIGLAGDLQTLDWERERKVLAAKIKDTDIRPFKIAKNFYQKCVNSDNVRMNGTIEILQHVKSFGGAPFLDSSWDEKNFNIKKLFEKESFNAVYFFLNHWIGLCPHPKKKSQEIVCLRNSTLIRIHGTRIDDIIHMYKELKINKQLIQSMYHKGIDYTISQKNLSEIDVNPGIFTISSFNNLTNNTLNWLKIINSQLTFESQLTEDSEIFIEKPEVIVKHLELMKVTPKETLADFFAFLFLYPNKHLFVVYSFDDKEKVRLGTYKSKQRWEQCVEHLSHNFGPALKALYAARYYKKEVHESVNNLARDVVKDLIDEINKLDINDNAKQDVVGKLNTARYVIGYPDEVLDLQKIEEFYKELELNGTEGIVESFLKIERNNKKLNIYPESNWKKQISRFSGINIIYLIDENIIYIPKAMIQYPFYHPNRSQFFNTATLFEQTAEALNHGIKFYLQLKWNIPIQLINTLQMAYNNYVKWEELGERELQLPGFFLTNHQMYWLVIAHKKYHKFQTDISEESLSSFETRNKNFHLQFKNQKSFRQAYNCSEMTEDEKNKINNFYLEEEMKDQQMFMEFQSMQAKFNFKI